MKQSGKNNGEKDALAQKEGDKAFMCSEVKECLSWSGGKKVCVLVFV